MDPAGWPAFFDIRISHTPICRGGAPTLIIVFPRSALSITQGTAKTYLSVSDGGENVGRSFCEACGTPLFAAPARDQGFVAGKVGSFDDPSGFKVQMDIWRVTAQPWQLAHDGASQFPTNPRELYRSSRNGHSHISIRAVQCKNLVAIRITEKGQIEFADAVVTYALDLHRRCR